MKVNLTYSIEFLKSLLVWSFVFLFVFNVKASSFIELSESNQEGQIWLNYDLVDFYEDSTSSLTLKEIRSNKQNEFVFDDRDSPLNDHVNSAYWLRFKFKDLRTHKKTLRLELYDFNIDEVSFYAPIESGEYESVQTGFSKAFTKREVAHKNMSFSLTPIITEHYYYLRLKSRGVVQIKPVIHSFENMYNYGLKEYSLLGFFYGLMLLMIFYNFLYFILLRKLYHLYYVVFASCVLVYLMGDNGTGFQVLWPDFPIVNQYVKVVSMFFAVAFMLLFTRNFLAIKNSVNDKWDSVIKLSVLLRFSFFIIQLYVPEKLVWGLIDLLYIQLMLVIGLSKLNKGIKSARWFVIAFCALDIAFFTMYGQQSGWIVSNVFTVYALYLGVVLQFIFISISIGESVKETYTSNNLAQAKLIIELERNDRLQGQVNRELEQKVHERTSEILNQKNIIESKNKHILDSVRYAQTIQKAVLPDEMILKRIILNHFLFFKPRDIVSGDFYWVHEINKDEYLVAAVDCTGHGVPGAFMSMIGINLLNRIVSEGVFEPAKIIEALHLNIQRVLRQEKTNNTDGMDIALCYVNRKEKVLKYSGAKNPLIYIQNNQIHKVRASRVSIGGVDLKAKAEFEEHSISFKESAIQFYLFSDGYIDQFGGEFGKKFMLKSFMSVLYDNKKESMSQQYEALKLELNQWMGEDTFQVDDIMVIGVKEEC